jgi:hypothetical protein
MFGFAAHWTTILIGMICWVAVSKEAASQCIPENPELAVFDVIASPKGEKVGTAFLVDSDLGLFVTAYHVLTTAATPTGQQDLLLKNGNFEFNFDLVASGNDSALLYNDWAILRAKVKDPSLGVRPLPALHLLYDWPGASAVTGSRVFASTGALRQVEGVEWRTDDQPARACDATNIVMLEVNSYDRGFSGAPIYVEKQCGVAGLASRFSLPKDVDDPTRKDLIKAFWAYTRRIDPEKSLVLDAEAKPAEDNFRILRELIKDKTFVKVVPSRCVIDQVILQSYADVNSRSHLLVKQEYQPEAKKIIKIIGDLDLNDPRQTTLTSDMIKSARLHWIDLLQILDSYLVTAQLKNFASMDYTELLENAILQKQRDLRYLNVRHSYRRAAKITRNADLDQGVGHSNIDMARQTLIASNVAWEAKEIPGLGLEVDARFSQRHSATRG